MAIGDYDFASVSHYERLGARFGSDFVVWEPQKPKGEDRLRQQGLRPDHAGDNPNKLELLLSPGDLEGLRYLYGSGSVVNP